jgi:dTDP-4-dehydrorhamnose 3,5-epimerase
MEFEGVGINGAWLVRSPVHNDERGYFREWFKASDIESATGLTFQVQQANVSSSMKGVLRGIHYSLASEGQGKWITCVSGSIWDVVVDIRPKSPTFKKWVGIELDAKRGDSLLISEGLGHGFISLSNDSTVTYLLTSKYAPSKEFEIHPLDPDLAINWPLKQKLLSTKDAAAPTLQQQMSAGNLKFEI